MPTSVGVVGLAAVAGNRLLAGAADTVVQRFSALAALDQPREQAELAVVAGAAAGLHAALHDVKGRSVDDRLMAVLHCDPLVRLLGADCSELEAIVRLLRGNRTDVDRVHQQVFDDAEIPHIDALLGISLLPTGERAAVSALAVPPGRTGHLHFLQPVTDVVRSVSGSGHGEDLPHKGRGFFVDQQMPLVVRVFLIPEGGDGAGEAALLRSHHVGGVHLL